MKREATDTLDLQNRLALRVPEAARCLGLSERHLRQILPRVPHFRAGGCVLLPVKALEAWLSTQAKTEAGKLDQAVKEVLEGLKVEPRRP